MHYLCTFSLGGHTVAGQRYHDLNLSFIFTNDGGENYFPGNSAGSADPTSVYA